jgi:hypothetical protein
LDVVHHRVIVIQNSEICAGDEPKVIGKAGPQTRGSVVGVAIGGPREEEGIDERGAGIALDIGPVVVLHENNENSFDRRKLARQTRGKPEHQSNSGSPQAHAVIYYELKVNDMRG